MAGWRDAPIIEPAQPAPAQRPRWMSAPPVEPTAADSPAPNARKLTLEVNGVAGDTPASEATQAVGTLAPGGDQPAGKGFWTRTLRGVRDLVDAGAQMLVRGVEVAIPDSWTTLDQWAKGEVAKVEGINRDAERDYQENWRGGDTGFDGARLLGNIVATAPLAALVPSGAGLGLAARTGLSAAGGGMFGTLQPVYDTSEGFWGAKAKQAGTGVMFGAAAAPLTAGLARIVSPRSSPQVQTMLNEGVTPTPGQVLGGAFKTTEEKLTSVPVLGDVIKAGQRRAIRQFNEATLRRALDPIDEALPRGSIGRDAIGQAQAALSISYDDVLNRVGAPAVDDQMLNELANLKSLLANANPGKRLDEQLDNIIGNEILSKTQYGRLTGEAIKTAEGNLGGIVRNLLRDADGDVRKLGEAVQEAQNILRQWVARNAPAGVAQDLQATNRGYANFMRAQRAASALGGEEGVFTPAQLLNAVKAMDPSRNKGAFARGDALLQDLAEPAKTVLSQSVPDSGTAGRLLASLIMGGAPVAAMVNPVAGAALLPAAAYAPGVQRGVAALLASRQGSVLSGTAEGMRALTPAMSALLAGPVAGAQ